MRKKWGRSSSSSHYSCEQHFPLNFFQCWGVHQQSANKQFKCTHVLYFEQFQGSYIWTKSIFALRVVPLWTLFWSRYGNSFVWSFYTRRLKMLSKTNRFKLFGKLGVDLFVSYALLHSVNKNMLRLIRAKRKIYMISDDPNVSLWVTDCPFYTRCIGLKDEYHQKRKNSAPYSPHKTTGKQWQSFSSILPNKYSWIKKKI